MTEPSDVVDTVFNCIQEKIANCNYKGETCVFSLLVEDISISEHLSFSGHLTLHSNQMIFQVKDKRFRIIVVED